MKKRLIFVCEFEACGREFSSRSALHYHLRRHKNIKPFECKICWKTFTAKSHLKAHITTHIEEDADFCIDDINSYMHVCPINDGLRDDFQSGLLNKNADSQKMSKKATDGKSRTVEPQFKGCTQADQLEAILKVYSVDDDDNEGDEDEDDKQIAETSLQKLAKAAPTVTSSLVPNTSVATAVATAALVDEVSKTKGAENNERERKRRRLNTLRQEKESLEKNLNSIEPLVKQYTARLQHIEGILKKESKEEQENGNNGHPNGSKEETGEDVVDDLTSQQQDMHPNPGNNGSSLSTVHDV